MLNCFATTTQNPTTPIIPIIEAELPTWLESQDQKTKNWLTATNFRAKSGTVSLLSNEQGHLEKILLGRSNTQDWSALSQLATTLPKGVYSIVTDAATPLYPACLAWGLANYQFTAYKKQPPYEAQLLLPESGVDVPYLTAVLQGTYLVRDLINTPAEDMMPVDLTEAASQLAERFGAKLHTIIDDELLTQGYAAIYTVGRGSSHPSCLIDMQWGDEKHPKLTLVGKGVCFDSGGLDIKGAAFMATMKKDMGGAAHALALAHIIMTLKLPVRLRVLIPAVENAVSADSYRPGDIICTRKGTTIEVTNTDAEGRVVLSEALDEASREKPDLLLDFATLTGAARVAMGTEIGALFTANDQLATDLMSSGQQENDPLWRLPLHAPYRKLIDSKIADIVNSASAPYGGAITAALFLQEFVPSDVTWAHLDIMAWNTTSKPGAPEGGEANGLRAVASYLRKRYVGRAGVSAAQ